MKSSTHKYLLILSVLVLIVCLSRLLPHIWSFTPIAAIALFSGAYFTEKKWALIIPMACLMLSDFLLQAQYWMGMTEYPAVYDGMWVVYLCFGLLVFLGFGLRNNVRVLPVVGASVMGSLIFFLATNFMVWYTTDMYSSDASGLMMSYMAALPFDIPKAFGDLLYTGLFFGAFEWSKTRFSVLERGVA